MYRTNCCGRILSLTVCAVLYLTIAPNTSAQSSRTAEPEEVKLTTKDGVRLGVTYYASSMGKKAVPVVMLHDYKESRAVFHALAQALHSPREPNQDSHAVLTVDLRGHGDSTTAEDVKALLLASPGLKSHGFSLIKPLRQPGVRREVSVFVVYGEGNLKASKDAKTIHKNLEKYHPRPKGREFPELVILPLPTELQGTKLLTDPQFNMLSRIKRFLEARLTEQDYEWLRRRPS